MRLGRLRLGGVAVQLCRGRPAPHRRVMAGYGAAAAPTWASRTSFHRPAPESQALFDGETGQLHSISPASNGGCAAAFARAFGLCADRPCIGRRSGPHEPFEWVSYGAFALDVCSVAAGLVRQLPAGARVGICAANSYEWIVTDFACLFAGMTSVALSNTWDPATLQAVGAQRGLAAIACDLASAPKCLEAARSILEPRAVLLLQPVPRARALRPAPEVLVLHFAALLCEPPLQAPVTRDATATHTIMHTSGTTGLPKGVEYSDSLWLSNMEHYPAKLCVAVSYQPLAFITDRHTVAITLWNGGRLGLVTFEPDKPKMESIITDLQEIRPTVLKGVPKFWQEIQVAARMQHDVGLGVLGGRACTLVCGAGALDPAVAAWYRSLADTSFLAGYGSTEVGNLAQNRKMLAHVEWKLLPREGFDVSQGTGELAVKTGDMMFGGYDGNPDRTASAFTEDGFYKMGDIVSISIPASGGSGVVEEICSTPQRGVAVLVDVLGRAGSSIKLSTGKWVAVERLEDIYRTCVGVRHVMVHGDNGHDQLVALVDREPGHQTDSEAAVLARFYAEAQSRGLNSFEFVAAVTFASRPFSQADQTLSGTDKLNRRNLLKEWGDQLEAALSAASEAPDPFGELDERHSFHEQGGTSIKANEIATLYAKLGVPREQVLLKLADDERSIGELKRELTRQSSAAAEVRHTPPAKIALPVEFTLDTALPSDKIGGAERAVLVTGATGFVGSFATAELLRQGRHVICTVRNAEGAAARHRVEGSLHDRGLWTADVQEACAMGRLSVISASLSRPFFGLSVAAFDELAARVDAILHLAAKVDLHGHFDEHRSANIGGVVEVLRLAFRARARLTFASTTDVLPAGCGDDEPMPSAIRDLPETDGYALSKLIGERLTETAVERGLSANIVRLGFIGGSSVTGVCNPKDFLCRLLIGICHTRSFPESSGPDEQTLTRFLPVDVAARALTVVLLGLENVPSTSGVVHVSAAGPDLSMRDLHAILLRYGPPFAPLPLLPFPQWMERAKLDGALSVWPVLRWAKGKEHFPAFNSRSARPQRLLKLLGDGVSVSGGGVLSAEELSLSETQLEVVIHGMLRHLFA
jgi:fatty acid CoA ligase FadD9